MRLHVSVRWVCVLALSALAGVVEGAPPVDAFVKDVTIVAAPGSPGTLVAMNSAAVPVVMGTVDRGGAFAPVILASPWAQGRVVAMAHSGYLDREALEQGQTALLLERLVRWAGGDEGVGEAEGAERLNGATHGTPRRIGIADGSLGEFLSQRGFATVKLSNLKSESLNGLDAVIVGGRSLSAGEQRDLAKFVRAGGGLVAAQTGWGWQQIAARGGRSPDMRTNSLNVVLRAAGIGWTDQMVETTARDAFDLTKQGPVERGAMHLPGAVELLRKADGPAPGRQAILTQAGATAIAGIRLLPSDETTIRPLLRSLIDAHGDSLVPSPASPIKADDALRRMLLAVQLDELDQLPADQIKAHAASAHFPGSVSAEAPRITRSMVLSATGGGWQSTGLYAPAGEVVTITRDDQSASKPWTLRIGVHTDTLWHLPAWKRAPDIVRSWSIGPGVTTVASPFGGLITIERGKAGSATVKIDGAVEAPRFVLGTTTRQQWQALRHAPAPWGEIETPGVVIAAPSSALAVLDDPTEVAELWQSILDHAADLRGISRTRARGERYVPDVQISAGYMHSGYPIMTHLDAVDDMTVAAKLRGGSWGLFHELGHNHQHAMWTFDGTVEVTCNLWSLYLMEKIAGKPISTGHEAVSSGERRQQRTIKHIRTGASFDRWKSDPFLALEMYIQLREAFGWGPFKQVFAEYDRLPADQRPETQQERRDQWMVRMSHAVRRNLGPFFERWGVPTSQEARDSIAHLEPWLPASLPEAKQP